MPPAAPGPTRGRPTEPLRGQGQGLQRGDLLAQRDMTRFIVGFGRRDDGGFDPRDRPGQGGALGFKARSFRPCWASRAAGSVSRAAS